MHPTKNIRNHAETLAETLSISEREAEAYLHWYVTGEETTRGDIANWMGISPSMVSRHLQNAKDHIETTDDTDKANALQQFLIRTDIGRTTAKTHQIMKSTFESNVFVVITEEKVKSHGEEYKIHIGHQHPSRNTNDFIENMPESMTLPDEWHMVTITGTTLTELLKHTQYYVENNPTGEYGNDMYLSLFEVFRDMPVSSQWLSEKAVDALESNA